MTQTGRPSALGARLRRAVGDPRPSTESDDTFRHALNKVGAAHHRRSSGRKRSVGRPHPPTWEPNSSTKISLEDAVGGHAVQTPYGPLWTITHRQPLDERHGARTLGDFFEANLAEAHRLTGDPRLQGRHPDEALFVDIEATGLEHGAGTLAFLVGVAFRENDELVTRQYLLREPGDEPALMHCLLADLDAHPLLVSFNGKSYDLTVLETRLVMCRFLGHTTCKLKLRPHLDLLHLSRNLHRGRWPDTRLGTLERELLDFHRVDDLPGALVPSTWFHFLRTGDAGPLSQAVEHNLHDVRSMVVLSDHLLRSARCVELRDRPPRVTANLGHLLLRRKDPEGAMTVLSRFLDDHHLPSPVREAALDTLSIAARRAGRSGVEVNALEALQALRPRDAEVLIRLSIAFERRLKDVPSALAAAREAERLQPTSATAARIRRLDTRLRRAGSALGGIPASPAVRRAGS